MEPGRYAATTSVGWRLIVRYGGPVPAPIVDFYWDVGSTNTYFAVFLLPEILERTGASVRWLPFNLGYVFRNHDYALSQEPAAKLRHRFRDLQRWAELIRTTNEGLERGVFGAPTFFVGDEMFWGKDRLDFLEAELERAARR